MTHVWYRCGHRRFIWARVQSTRFVLSCLSPLIKSDIRSIQNSDGLQWPSRSFTYCNHFKKDLIVVDPQLYRSWRDFKWQWIVISRLRGPSAVAELLVNVCKSNCTAARWMRKRIIADCSRTWRESILLSCNETQIAVAMKLLHQGLTGD